MSSLTLVHGANGNLGSLIVKELLKQGAVPNTIVAAVRDVNAEGSKKLIGQGVLVRSADYKDPASLEKAYAGIDTVVFVPTMDGQLDRVIGAENSIVSAKKAGVRRFLAVSWGNGRADSLQALSPAYVYVENRVRTIGGLQWLIVRQGVWFENGLDSYKHAIQSGYYGAAGAKIDTRLPFIGREDCARGIAAAALKKDLVGRVLDLENNVAVSFGEVAEVLSEIAGKKVVFSPITDAQLEGILAGSLPDFLKFIAPDLANMFSRINQAGTAGEYHVSNDLYELTGKSAESARDWLKRHLKA